MLNIFMLQEKISSIGLDCYIFGTIHISRFIITLLQNTWYFDHYSEIAFSKLNSTVYFHVPN